VLTQRNICANKPSEGTSARGGPRTFNGYVESSRLGLCCTPRCSGDASGANR